MFSENVALLLMDSNSKWRTSLLEVYSTNVPKSSFYALVFPEGRL